MQPGILRLFPGSSLWLQDCFYDPLPCFQYAHAFTDTGSDLTRHIRPDPFNSRFAIRTFLSCICELFARNLFRKTHGYGIPRPSKHAGFVNYSIVSAFIVDAYYSCPAFPIHYSLPGRGFHSHIQRILAENGLCRGINE